MIKVDKKKCPEILEKQKVEWTKERDDSLKKNVKPPQRYQQNPEIKEVLKSSSHGKCIYCESLVEPVYFGDVEHIKPKTKYPELAFEWENLGFVCARCNNAKRDKYDETNPPINPYEEELSDFLLALRAFIKHKPGNVRGKATISDVGLNRPGLIEARDERIRRIEKMIGWYKAASARSVKDSIYKEIVREVSVTKEYYFCCKSLVG